MEKHELEEVIACLPKGRTLFHYHRDRYVLYLLERLVRRGELRTLADLRKSPYASWLNKPLLKTWAAKQGRPDAPLETLLHHWPEELENTTYLLSLGRWGSELFDSYYQTSRPGLNLVLHLNLPMEHERRLRNVGVDDVWYLQRSAHPLAESRITLAWARIDLDWASGQAIVEEIQSDWLRDMPALFNEARATLKNGERQFDWQGMPVNALEMLRYQDELRRHEKLWSEATLTAALWFLQHELGIREVFYHSWQTGVAVKRMPDYSVPPRSLYTELPERFGFQRTRRGPEFLERDPKVKKVKKRQTEWNWYHWAA